LMGVELSHEAAAPIDVPLGIDDFRDSPRSG